MPLCRLHRPNYQFIFRSPAHRPFAAEQDRHGGTDEDDEGPQHEQGAREHEAETYDTYVQLYRLLPTNAILTRRHIGGSQNGATEDASSIDPSAPGETPETIITRSLVRLIEAPAPAQRRRTDKADRSTL